MPRASKGLEEDDIQNLYTTPPKQLTDEELLLNMFCVDDLRRKRSTAKRKHGSWANLKGEGQLATKAWNGEQMRGMVSGLGSVSGCPRPTTWQRRNGVYGHKID